MLDSGQHQMGRPMLVPPWAADLDPTEKLIHRPIVDARDKRDCAGVLCFALLCCSVHARLLSRLPVYLDAWPPGDSELCCVAVTCLAMPCHVMPRFSRVDSTRIGSLW